MGLHSLAVDTLRFSVRSSEEGTLTVDAADWAAALCLVMQILELEDRVPFLISRRGLDGNIVATDPGTGHSFVIHQLRTPALAALAA